MELRKLQENEHHLTRKLWEEVFAEDTEEFLDYYYFLKTRENEIYVIEEENQIRSMLHLNPYTIAVEDATFEGHYIVAVATEQNYRKRRYMQKLLCTSMLEMYQRKEPFTFLMPAAEAIYAPYDFRFIYDQKKCKVTGNPGKLQVELKEASMFDIPAMVYFFEKHAAPKYQVYAVRDKDYYRTVLFEQQSQHGGIMLMKSGTEIVGMFFYSWEGEFAVREPLYLEEYEEEFQKAIYVLKKEQEQVQIYAARETGINVEEQSIIMARILHLERFLSLLKVKDGECLDCSFAVIDAVLMKNSKICRITAGQDGEQSLKVRETEDSEGVLTIAALTSLTFGYKTVDEIREEEGVFLSERLASELKKIEPLKRVFLNEVV